jgi:protocatechuate 3,4-dioxygenase beta subunit
MNRQTSNRLRTWGGRPLPRPAEDLDEQGLGFDLQTVLNRRMVLRGACFVGLGGVGIGALSSCGSLDPAAPTDSGDTTRSSLEEIPEETAGPYPGDGSNGPDALEESGIIRSDIRSSFGDAAGTAEGVPMTLELTISDLANGGSAMAGVAVYVWHCDREGRYSMYSEGVDDENYLRGVQIANGDGVVRFSSIFPACYSGRWPHIHFEVYPDRKSIGDATNAIATSQVALPKAPCENVYATDGYEQSVANLSRMSLKSDNVFGDDGGTQQLGTVTGSVNDGYVVKLAVRVDTSTEPDTGGAAPGSDGRPPGAPSGAPPSDR